jgi:RNA polymerase sigma-70 factor (ECF subfamily)
MMGLMRPDRFEELYEEHARPLLAFLVYRTGDRALAEDLVADTFERVLRARRPVDPRKAREKTWIYSIALNCLRDSKRRESAEGRALERAVTVPAQQQVGAFDLVAERDSLQRALDGLSPEEREAIALRYGADLSVPEIGMVLHEKLTTVEGRVYRALRKLRETLDEAEASESASPGPSQSLPTDG